MSKLQSLIDERISIMHQLDKISNRIKSLQIEAEDEVRKKKLAYYEEHLEKDNPVPNDYVATP